MRQCPLQNMRRGRRAVARWQAVDLKAAIPEMRERPKAAEAQAAARMWAAAQPCCEDRNRQLRPARKRTRRPDEVMRSVYDDAATAIALRKFADRRPDSIRAP